MDHRPPGECPRERQLLAGAVVRLRRAVGMGAVLAGGLAVALWLPMGVGDTDAVPLRPAVPGVQEATVPELPVVRPLGEGRASYYSDLLEGRPTASGEPYRGGELTAAHRSLPFGSRLRVTNLANCRSVVLRINDRGPYARNRVLDVSRAAADLLGMRTPGHARVRLELVE